jgi:hypothetical protein
MPAAFVMSNSRWGGNAMGRRLLERYARYKGCNRCMRSCRLMARSSLSYHPFHFMITPGIIR